MFQCQDIVRLLTLPAHAELMVLPNAQAWEVLQKHIKRIAELAGDAAEDIIENHPKLKKAVGDNLDKIKQYGDSYGPEAKKM